MSPTATIATVVVALIFFAWLFQSDTKDPGYEAWMKRQQEEKKSEQAQKAALGINVTDSGITKDDAPLEPNRNLKSFGSGGEGGGFVLSGNSGLGTNLSASPDDPNSATRPVVVNSRPGFGSSAKLNGTYVGVAYAGDLPAAQNADAPCITFRRDSTFSTQNMSSAEVDMESGAAASLDRGSGKYKLFANTLELTYTDGLARKKGPHRAYTVVLVEGEASAPAAFTIQGKIFKLDKTR
jgi:hypothetical protein